jgi:hypothetical protein
MLTLPTLRHLDAIENENRDDYVFCHACYYALSALRTSVHLLPVAANGKLLFKNPASW